MGLQSFRVAVAVYVVHLAGQLEPQRGPCHASGVLSGGGRALPTSALAGSNSCRVRCRLAPRRR
jgi:hypothetical protein